MSEAKNLPLPLLHKEGGEEAMVEELEQTLEAA